VLIGPFNFAGCPGPPRHPLAIVEPCSFEFIGYVQYFSLTTKQHQPAYQPQKPSTEQLSYHIWYVKIKALMINKSLIG
jgi:hypothetical protein